MGLELEGRSMTIFVVTTVLFAIAFVFVCLRCFVRLKIVKSFGWDDGFMVLAMALNIFFATCGIAGSLHGFAKRFRDLDETQIKTALLWWWLGQLAYVITCIAAKISIVLSLLRLTIKRIHIMILWTDIVLTVIVGLLFWFLLMLQCRPVEYFWDKTKDGQCLDTNVLYIVAYVYSITAAVCDFTVGILPVFLIWNLQMNPRTKWGVVGILSLGCIASAAVVIRIPYLHDYFDKDFLYATANISIWSNVEASLGITAGSLVTLRPLFRWFRDGSFQSYRSMKRTNTSILLSNLSARDPTAQLIQGPRGPGYWRPDVDPEDTHAIVTAGANPDRRKHHHRRRSTNSSQEDLNPKGQGSANGGVSVQKTFVVISNNV
ncbi:hypothetical protein VTN02DRAFT_2060 [Thermoascus thermophilus]